MCISNRSQLIWICSNCHLVCEFVSTAGIKYFDWLIIRSMRNILIYSAWRGFDKIYIVCFRHTIPTIYNGQIHPCQTVIQEVSVSDIQYQQYTMDKYIHVRL